MKKKVFLFILLAQVLFYSSCASSKKAPGEDFPQKNLKVEIRPQVGVSEIKLGMSEALILEIMGEPKYSRGYEEERKLFLKDGEIPPYEILFILGFDKVYEYSHTKNKSEYPIWKLYFKSDKLVYINVSGFIYKIEEDSVGVLPRLSIWCDKREMVQTLGDDFIHLYDEMYNSHRYYYPREGIIVVIDDDMVSSIHIHTKLNRREIRDYEELVGE